MIGVKIALTEQEKNFCYEIRKEVFVKGQKISSELDSDGLDSEAEHVILFRDNMPAGCARIRYIDGKIKLERLAVLEKYRGESLGLKIMEFVIEYAKEKKVSEIFMSAQKYLERFYEKFGFETIGEPYEEVGIIHVKMKKIMK